MKNQAMTILFIITLLTVLPVSAQELKVKSFSQTIDQTANLSENLHKDLNGDYGGMIKVYIAASKAAFECSRPSI